MSKWMQKIDFNSSEQKYEDGEISFQENIFSRNDVQPSNCWKDRDGYSICLGEFS